MAEQAKTLTFNKKNVVKESGSDRVFSFIVHAFLIVIMLMMIYPLYFVVIASISDPFDVVNGRVFLWPVNFSLDSYAHVMGTNSIWVGYKNTIINTVIYVAYSLCITIPAAYVVAKRNLPGRRLLNLFFLITMFFGGGMVPTYLMYKEFGMLNTRWSLILTSTSCYNMIVARTYTKRQKLTAPMNLPASSALRCRWRAPSLLLSPCLWLPAYGTAITTPCSISAIRACILSSWCCAIF